jgi:hypothetical protein
MTGWVTVSFMFHPFLLTIHEYKVITNYVSDSYQQIYVIIHIICNHPLCYYFELESM